MNEVEEKNIERKHIPILGVKLHQQSNYQAKGSDRHHGEEFHAKQRQFAELGGLHGMRD